MDEQLFRFINHGFASPATDWIMLLLSGKWLWIAAAVVLVGLAAWKRSPKLISVCLQIAVTLSLADGISYQVLKPFFGRERPCHALKDVRTVNGNCGGDFGMPSNHAANGMGVAVVVARTLGGVPAVAAAAFALLVGMSRVYLGVHYPGDVLGGFAVGAVLALLCNLVARRIEPWVTRLRGTPSVTS